MTDFQPTHRHKVTGEKLQRITIDGVDITEMTRIKTVHGFYYWVDTDMLEPLAPTEKWENVQSDSSFVKDGAINSCASTVRSGGMMACIECAVKRQWGQFCSHCGDRLFHLCKTCQKKVKEGETYCWNCGMNQKE
jgi:hypothetical protein